MKAAVYYSNRDIRLEEMPVPRIGAGELLVKVMASGICGSDILEWYRLKQAPRVLGHEIAGDVVRSGKGVARFKPGDRVFVSHHVPCNTCYYCLSGHHTACETLHTTNFDPGGFSQFIRVPCLNTDRGTFPLPEEISYEEGTFIEPLGCVLRSQKLARIRPGESILVIGTGISGILHIKLAAVMGAGRIFATDLSPFRLEMAQKAGAHAVFPAPDDLPEKLRSANDGRLAGLVILCTGSLSAAEQAIQSAERGGRVMFFAVPHPDDRLSIPINRFWRNDMTLFTSYAANSDDLGETIELLRNNRVTVADMITHRLPLSEINKGFQLVEQAEDSLKVIIEPQRL